MDHSEAFAVQPLAGEFETEAAPQAFEILDQNFEQEFSRRGAASRSRPTIRRAMPTRPAARPRRPRRPPPWPAWPPYGGYVLPVAIEPSAGGRSSAAGFEQQRCVQECLERGAGAAPQPEPDAAGGAAPPDASAATGDAPEPSADEFEFAAPQRGHGNLWSGADVPTPARRNNHAPRNSMHKPCCACTSCRSQRDLAFRVERFAMAPRLVGPPDHEAQAFGETGLLGEAEAVALVEELFAIESEEDLDLFLGKLVKSVGRAAGGAVRAVAKAARSLPLRDIANVAFKAARGDIAGLLLPLLPAPMQKTVRAFTTDPFARFALQTTRAALRGENVLRAAQVAAKAGIDDVRERMRFAAMVAPFVPGIGSGVAAALGAASALAGGEPISQALIAAARSAVPGGAVAQAAFDLGANLAQGKSLSEAALATARNQLPGGPAAKAAFDAALALAQGKKIQDAAFAAAGAVLPKSPYAAGALSFARRVAAGEDIRKAALSTAGNAVMRRLERQGVNVLGGAQRRMSARYPTRFGTREAEWIGEAEGEAEFEAESSFEAESDGAMAGRWMQRGDQLVVFGV